MTLQVCVKVTYLVYISSCAISIWALYIEIKKLKSLEHKFLAIQQIVSYVFYQMENVKRLSMYLLNDYWDVIYLK